MTFIDQHVQHPRYLTLTPDESRTFWDRRRALRPYNVPELNAEWLILGVLLESDGSSVPVANAAEAVAAPYGLSETRSTEAEIEAWSHHFALAWYRIRAQQAVLDRRFRPFSQAMPVHAKIISQFAGDLTWYELRTSVEAYDGYIAHIAQP